MTDQTRDAFEAFNKWRNKFVNATGYTPTEADAWNAATAAERERCALVWLPIEDAPKDAYVLLWIDIVIGHPLVVQGCWFHDDDEDEKGWIDLDGKVLHATYWMPLTPPPAIRQGGEA